uniref:Uncharacterized protein n=1 Tax=Anopheles arabiensis TaxID=7173 RepID=A0A182IES8_ANOAR
FQAVSVFTNTSSYDGRIGRDELSSVAALFKSKLRRCIWENVRSCKTFLKNRENISNSATRLRINKRYYIQHAIWRKRHRITYLQLATILPRFSGTNRPIYTLTPFRNRLVRSVDIAGVRWRDFHYLDVSHLILLFVVGAEMKIAVHLGFNGRGCRAGTVHRPSEP